MSELLPCPFCGVVPEPVYIGSDRVVLCQEELCPSNLVGNLDQAIRAWNTRLGDPCHRAKTDPRKFWINMYQDGSHRTHTSRKQADKASEYSNRTECIEVVEVMKDET